MALAVVVLLPVWYVGSYSPALRLVSVLPSPLDGQLLAAYGPVEWLIDQSPLSEPLYAWADLWGVGEDQLRQEMARKGAIPMIDPPWVNLTPKSPRSAGP